jgi:hypothetical protein
MTRHLPRALVALLLVLGALTLAARPASATTVCDPVALLVNATASVAPVDDGACLKEAIAYGAAVVNYGAALAEWNEANKSQDPARMLRAAQQLDVATAGVVETGTLLVLCLITLL